MDDKLKEIDKLQKNVSEQSVTALFIQKKMKRIAAIKNHCWSRLDITFIRDWECRLYSYNTHVIYCAK